MTHIVVLGFFEMVSFMCWKHLIRIFVCILRSDSEIDMILKCVWQSGFIHNDSNSMTHQVVCAPLRSLQLEEPHRQFQSSTCWPKPARVTALGAWTTQPWRISKWCWIISPFCFWIKQHKTTIGFRGNHQANTGFLWWKNHLFPTSLGVWNPGHKPTMTGDG